MQVLMLVSSSPTLWAPPSWSRTTIVWTPLAFSSWVAALIVVGLVEEVDGLDAARRDDVRRALERQPDEPDLGAGDGLDV